MRLARCLYNLKTPLGAKSTTGTYPNTSNYKKLQNLQSHFLADDGLLVWQKLGSRDKFLYLSSLGLVISGGALLVNVLYRMSFGLKDK